MLEMGAGTASNRERREALGEKLGEKRRTILPIDTTRPRRNDRNEQYGGYQASQQLQCSQFINFKNRIFPNLNSFRMRIDQQMP
jgi:hypothetical protein